MVLIYIVSVIGNIAKWVCYASLAVMAVAWGDQFLASSLFKDADLLFDTAMWWFAWSAFTVILSFMLFLAIGSAAGLSMNLKLLGREWKF